MLFRKKRNDPSDMNPNEKINYNEFDLLDELHARAFAAFEQTLNTADFVPQNYIDKVYQRIYKAVKKQYKKLGKTNKEFQKWFNIHLPELIAVRKEKQVKAELQQLKDGDNEQKQK